MGWLKTLFGWGEMWEVGINWCFSLFTGGCEPWTLDSDWLGFDPLIARFKISVGTADGNRLLNFLFFLSKKHEGSKCNAQICAFGLSIPVPSIHCWFRGRFLIGNLKLPRKDDEQSCLRHNHDWSVDKVMTLKKELSLQKMLCHVLDRKSSKDF